VRKKSTLHAALERSLAGKCGVAPNLSMATQTDPAIEKPISTNNNHNNNCPYYCRKKSSPSVESSNYKEIFNEIFSVLAKARENIVVETGIT
jgi:hypothetical protein